MSSFDKRQNYREYIEIARACLKRDDTNVVKGMYFEEKILRGKTKKRREM